MTNSTKIEKLLNLSNDVKRAEKIMFAKDTDERFPDVVTLPKVLHDLIDEALIAYAEHLGNIK